MQSCRGGPAGRQCRHGDEAWCGPVGLRLGRRCAAAPPSRADDRSNSMHGLPEWERPSAAAYTGLIEKIPHLQELSTRGTMEKLLPMFGSTLRTRRQAGSTTGVTRVWPTLAPHPASTRARIRWGRWMSFATWWNRAGLEVVLDVVFNHTAEGNDNPRVPAASRTKLEPDRSRYANYSGTGNTLDDHSVVRRMIVDSLHSGVGKMHVQPVPVRTSPLVSHATAGPRDPFPMILTISRLVLGPVYFLLYHLAGRGITCGRRHPGGFRAHRSVRLLRRISGAEAQAGVRAREGARPPRGFAGSPISSASPQPGSSRPGCSSCSSTATSGYRVHPRAAISRWRVHGKVKAQVCAHSRRRGDRGPRPEDYF